MGSAPNFQLRAVPQVDPLYAHDGGRHREQSRDGQGAGRDGHMTDVPEIARLQKAIQRLHGCRSSHVGSVDVHETFDVAVLSVPPR